MIWLMLLRGKKIIFQLGISTWAMMFFFCFSTPFSLSEEIYRWTDEKGVVHFTDDISNVPHPYQKRVDKIDVTGELSKGTEKQTDLAPVPRTAPKKTRPPVKEKPDRVSEHLMDIDKKIEEKRKIQREISKLEEEMRQAEERIRFLEKDEEENYPLIQPFHSGRRFNPVEPHHHQEKVRLSNRIKFIKDEIATLEKRLSEIQRSL